MEWNTCILLDDEQLGYIFADPDSKKGKAEKLFREVIQLSNELAAPTIPSHLSWNQIWRFCC